ncbi:MAG: hypothetical protein AAFX06_16520 [Planctomycetota bacterium]
MEKIEIIAEEYRSLRAEQIARMNHRITLITASVTAAGVLIAFGIRFEPRVLLVVPVICSVFGLLVLACTTLIADIGDFLRRVNEQGMNEIHPGSIGWHISQGDKASSRFVDIFGTWHLPQIITIVAPSTFSMVAYFQKVNAVGFADIVLLTLGILLLLYFVYAYLVRMFAGKTPRKKNTDRWVDQIQSSSG